MRPKTNRTCAECNELKMEGEFYYGYTACRSCTKKKKSEAYKDRKTKPSRYSNLLSEYFK